VLEAQQAIERERRVDVTDTDARVDVLDRPSLLAVAGGRQRLRTIDIGSLDQAPGGFGHHQGYCAVNVSCMPFTELSPTQTSNVPGSTTNRP